MKSYTRYEIIMVMRKMYRILVLIFLGIFISILISDCGHKPKVKRKLVIVGIDAGEWNLINPLVAENKLPNFKKLIGEGALGELITFPRTRISPVLWTSILTGKMPDKTGIKGFLSTKGFPVNSTMRRVKDLPEILSENGYSVGFVGFWASWPAEKVNGWMVSDLLSLGRYKDTNFQLNYQTNDYSYLLSLKEVTYPEDFLQEIYPKLIPPEQIPRQAFEQIAFFNDSEWERFQQIKLLTREDIESLLKFAYVSDLNFQRVALYLAREKKPEVLAVYFEGADILGHFFWKYMEPEYFSNINPREQERFQNAIKNYYQIIDSFIGELLQASGPETACLVISDHGMKRVKKEGSAGLHSGTHSQGRVNGIIIFAGAGIKKGIKVKEPRILDITPTVLYYLGLPVGKDMDGKVLTEMFEEEFLKKNPLQKIRTYDKKPRRVKEKGSPLDQEIVNKLRSLGYIR